jgi:hypothetical protein
MTAVVFCANHQLKPEKIDLVALSSQVGPIAAAARAQARDLVRRAAIDTHGFRFGKLLDYRDVMFLPGGAKYGDVPGLLALAGGSELLLAGEADGPPLARQAYAGAERKLSIDQGDAKDRAGRVVAWLSK